MSEIDIHYGLETQWFNSIFNSDHQSSYTLGPMSNAAVQREQAYTSQFIQMSKHDVMG